MLLRLLHRVWNRRKRPGRIQVKLGVIASDAEGATCRLESEDLGVSGIRLRFREPSLGVLLGHRDEVPLQVHLTAGDPPVKAEARLVWAFRTASGETLSGWEFVRFHENGERLLQVYLAECRLSSRPPGPA